MSNATNNAANDNNDLAACLDVAEDIAATFDAQDRLAEQARLAALALTHYRGSKYDRARPLRETATMIRRELAAAGKASTGPLAGCVCRVTTRRASMMVAIDVEIVSVPSHGTPIINGRWVESDAARTYRPGPSPTILSKRGTAMIEAAQAIVDAYNFNKSDSMTDYSSVGFYGGVTFDSTIKEAAIAEVRATLALLAQA